MKAPSAPDTTPALSAWLPAFLSNAVIWGASFVFIKIAVDGGLHPTYVAAGRVVAGALALVLILLVTRDRLPRDPRLWAHMIVPGVVGTVIPFTLFSYGEQRIPSVVAGIWNATTALWVLPIAVLIYRTETFSARKAIGLGVGFVGVATVLGFWHIQGDASLTGQAMCAAAAICYGFSIPYLKRFVSGRTDGGRPVSGVAFAACQLIVASVVLIVVSPLIAGPPPAPADLSWGVLASVAVLGIFGSGIAFALNMRVIEVKGASTTAFVTYLIPVVATILGVTVMSETFTWNQPVGAAIVLVGVAYAQGVFSSVRRRPGQQLLGRPRVDDPVRG
ncbi:drug/metabolite transporter (DMT)-like permease [Allocatelliglobosispora scoriae]|uniref:Drug/metabolite transporter (DMT)-like permease n=1 Tax=Allocatelliglobosispora scoriae TaxID=643052 RepID=A0A841BTZ3_9ACTN|nr:DMT family transporter [Allocatelliglobosispora scoriae]MBB5871165.1 drug/metabolite transporter (DMT)-like permease [Allocatelliglobosispora scoriae]